MEVEQFSNMAVKYTMEWFLPHMQTHTLEISWDRRPSTLRIQLLSVVLAWWESQSAHKTLQMKFYQYTTKCMYCSTVLKWKVHVEMTKQELNVPCAFGILVHVCICFSGGSGNTIWLNWACCFKDCAQQTNQISVSHTPCEKQSTPVTGEYLGSSTVLRCHQLDTGIFYTFWLLHSLNVMTNRC